MSYFAQKISITLLCDDLYLFLILIQSLVLVLFTWMRYCEDGTLCARRRRVLCPTRVLQILTEHGIKMYVYCHVLRQCYKDQIKYENEQFTGSLEHR